MCLENNTYKILFIQMCVVCMHVLSLKFKLKQVTKKLNRLSLRSKAEENIRPKLFQEKKKHKNPKPSEKILKPEESCRGYQELEGFQKAQEQDREVCPAEVPGSQPTCRQGRADSHGPGQAGAGGAGGRHAATPAGARGFSLSGGGAGRFHSSQCSSDAVVSAVQARNHPGK